jgi:omega-amidase
MEGVKIGIGICYDIRFPELSMSMAQKGAEVLVFPASFNATTGPLHFQLLGQARALDTQSFVALSAPARDFEVTTGYQTWGHSQVINPNGLVVAQGELRENIVTYDVDMQDVANQRRGFPFNEQRRNDLFELTEKIIE